MFARLGLVETSDWSQEEVEARLGYREPELDGELKKFPVN